MSSGAGYCDCGDLEAWKANAFCDAHIQGYNEVFILIIYFCLFTFTFTFLILQFFFLVSVWKS